MNKESFGPGQSSPKSVLRNTHPLQNTYTFDKITVSSAFDSGNMSRCT